MEGVWRVGEHFARCFTPAVFLLPYESLSDAALDTLGRYLGKPVRVFTDVHTLNKECAVWLSIAVDFPSPYIANPERTATTVAIIHDDLCARGVFGEAKRELYRMGATNNDAFFFTTTHAWTSFTKHGFMKKLPAFAMGIGCPHSYGRVEQVGTHVRTLNTAVHSVYPRKNLTAEAKLAFWFGEELTHAGKIFDTSADDIYSLTINHGLCMTGEVTDSQLKDLYSRTKRFICLSKDEGFSIPAMEAMFNGVREIWLSDIPAHREVYGRCNINWINLAMPGDSAILASAGGAQHVTDDQVHSLWQRFHHENLLYPFRKLYSFCHD